MKKNSTTKLLMISNTSSSFDHLVYLVRDAFPNASIIKSSTIPTGFELIATEDPDAILLVSDIAGIDAFETCRQLKTDGRTEALPMILLTTDTITHNIRTRAFEAGGAYHHQ